MPSGLGWPGRTVSGVAGEIGVGGDAAPRVAAPAAARSSRFAALRSPNFRALWIGLLVSNAGSQMQLAGQGWLVRDLHAEPVYLGLLSLSAALPMLLLTPFGGVVADRLPRIRLLKFTQTGMLIQGTVLAGLALAGWIEFWHILVLSLVSAALLALDNPGRQALLPDLVPAENLSSAVSLNSVAWSGSALFGPALAGILLVPFGPGGLFLLNAVSYLAVLWALFRLRDLPPDVRHTTGSLASGVLEGARYTLSRPELALPLLMVTLSNFFGRSYQALMPIFARDVIGTGPEGYGLLLAAPGAGALVGGFGLAATRSMRRQVPLAIAGWFAFAASLGLFAVSGHLAVALVLLFLGTIAITVFNAVVATALQLQSPRHLRGRVMSLMVTSNIGLTNLGGMASAGAATYVGVPHALAGAAGVLLVAGVVASLLRSWRLDLSPHVHTESSRP